MSDVRLVGTNPDDGSLVPVSVTAAGLLRTAIGKIEKIPNDVEIEGDLTVTGTINGSSGGGGEPGGEYLPEPFGEEGTVLTIVDGAPAWAELPEGGGGGEPTGPRAIYVDNSLTGGAGLGLFGCDGNPASVAADQDAWAKGLSCFFNSPDGRAKTVLSGGSSWSSTITINLDQCLGHVLTIGINGNLNYVHSNTQVARYWDVTVSHDADNINDIKKYQSFSSPTSGDFPWATEMSFLLNRDSYSDVTFQARLTSSNIPTNQPAHINWVGWKLEDAGAFALQQQIKAQKRIEELEKALQALKA